VSGHHAIVLQEQGEWYVQDAQSTNGTFINGRKLAKGSRERLQNGAVIGLGPKVKVEFRVQP
jgi:pSer/pThr/pTyr-binding forkhead associated (FHA) protein